MQNWAITDAGNVRQQNQDAYQMKKIDRNAYVLVVCDGMGGAKSGNVASTLAVDVFVQEIEHLYHPTMDLEDMEQIVERAVKKANFTVFDQSCQFPEFNGMGTTLVAALVRGRQMVVANVGDSRAYRITQEDIFSITTDHSLAQLMFQRGELTAEQLRSFPGKNYITRAIGTEASVKCDLFLLELDRGDCILLCSDGLTNLLDEQEILFEVVHGISKSNCCERLLNIAKNRGAPDNVTVVLAQV